MGLARAHLVHLVGNISSLLKNQLNTWPLQLRNSIKIMLLKMV
jgi:hypothetical protein